MPLVKNFARTGSFEGQRNETFAFIPEFQTFPHFSLTTHLEALKVSGQTVTGLFSLLPISIVFHLVTIISLI